MEDFEKITESEINENDVEGNSNPLKGTVAENQGIFDKLPKLIANKVNALIDFVNNIKNNIINEHLQNADNPHGVTKKQVGLSEVDNTSDVDKPISTATQKALDDKVDKVEGKGLSTLDFDYAVLRQIDGTWENLEQFKSDTETNLRVYRNYLSTLADNDNLLNENLLKHEKNNKNPHEVTKEQVGLSNVDNTADKDKPVSDAMRTELDKFKQKYQKIKEFTTEEGILTYDVKTDSDGKSLKLEDVTIYIKTPESFTLTDSWTISALNPDDGTKKTMLYLNAGNASSGTGKYFIARAQRISQGFWWNVRFSKLNAATYGASFQSSYAAFDTDYINGISFSLTNAPTGTIIVVYGREVVE